MQFWSSLLVSGGQLVTATSTASKRRCVFVLSCLLRYSRDNILYIRDPGHQGGLLVRNMHTRRNAPVTHYIGDHEYQDGILVTRTQSASTSRNLLPLTPSPLTHRPDWHRPAWHHVPADTVPPATTPRLTPSKPDNYVPHSTTLRHTRQLCATLDNSAPHSTTLRHTRQLCRQPDKYAAKLDIDTNCRRHAGHFDTIARTRTHAHTRARSMFL